MAYLFSERSKQRLQGVHPHLVAIATLAIAISEQDFLVVEGVRSREQCKINYGKGRTAEQCIAKGIEAHYANPAVAKVTWLANPFNSKHCTQSDGYGRAIDLCPYPVDWSNLSKFDKIAEAMFEAQKQLKAEGKIPQSVNLRWGADWDGDGKVRERGESDSPHFEI